MIYLCFIIPLIAVLFLTFVFKAKVIWWERIVIFAAPAVLIIVAKFVSVGMQTMDQEYLTFYATKATYFEPWDEWVHQTCYRTVCHGAGKSRSCTSVPYDCSHRVYHPARWELYDNGGNTYPITQSRYEDLVRTWANSSFQDLNRHYYHQDGDAYNTLSDGRFEHVQPICKTEFYENKVQASKSIFNFQDVSDEEVKSAGLFRYPITAFDRYDFHPIFGLKDDVASLKLERWNALLGTSKQVKMLILVFHDQPYETAMLQESYWKGGNKNEFILLLSLEKSNSAIQWSKVLSWTENEELKVRVARRAKEIGPNIPMIVDTMVTDVNKNFVRKNWADFNYLSVEPTGTAVIVTMVLTLVLTIGLSIFSVMNQFTEGKH